MQCETKVQCVGSVWLFLDILKLLSYFKEAKEQVNIGLIWLKMNFQ